MMTLWEELATTDFAALDPATLEICFRSARQRAGALLVILHR